MYEIQPLINNIHKKNKDSWEQTRLLGYITAQIGSTKKLKLTDILQFPWDEDQEDSNTSITDSDIERLRSKAKNYLKGK